MAVSNRKVVEYFEHIWAEAEEEHQRVRGGWRANLELYNDIYDFGEKLDWQTKLREPITDNLIVRMTNFFSRILITSDNEYFTVKHKQSTTASGLKDLTSTVLRDNEFPSVFSDALKYSLLTSPYVNKVTYKYHDEAFPSMKNNGEITLETDTVGRVVVEFVNPFNIRLDPRGDSYIIEQKTVDLADFKAIGRANGWTNIDAVALKVGKKRAQEEDVENFRPRVRLHYVYTKALTDNMGNILDDNVHFIIAEGEHVVLYKKNFLPKGMFPYVVGFPMKVITGRYGRGYISKLRSLLVTYIESMNLLMDSFMLATLGAYEVVEPNIGDDADHLFSSLSPGRLYPVKEPNTLNRVFDSAVDPMAPNIVFLLDKLIQNRSFQNEFFQGQPTAKGRPTASEVSIKTRESVSFFSDIANEIERTIITPLLELVISTELIHMDDRDHVDFFEGFDSTEAMKGIRSLSFTERINALKNSMIEVTGISGKVQQLGNFEKIVQILNVIGNIPSLANAIDPKKLAEKIFESVDIAPDEILSMALLDQLSESQGGTGEAPAGGVGGSGTNQNLSPEQLVSQIRGGLLNNDTT